MTQDEILCMAREAGLEQVVSIDPKNGGIITKSLPPKLLERFATLVAAHERERAWTEKDWGEAAEWIRQQEREACAKVCDENAAKAEANGYTCKGETFIDGFGDGSGACAAAIRARGEK